VSTRRTLSVPWLATIFVVALLGPILVHGAVGPGPEDDVRLANASRDRSPTSAPATTAAPTTTTRPGTSGGGSGGDDDPEEPASTTTTTKAPPSTTTTAEPGGTTTTTGPPATPTTQGPADQSTTVMLDEVLRQVNEARANSTPACGPLEVDESLQLAAQSHSDDMSARNYLDHVSPEGQEPGDRAAAAGYTGSYVGENIGQGFSDAASAMAAWMGSEGHRENIDNCDYKVIGIGVNPDGWYWTQVFGV
jgi:uncharacterized protein YkwD